VGNPTEPGLDPTNTRYVWEIETGKWVKKAGEKGAGRPAPVEEAVPAPAPPQGRKRGREEDEEEGEKGEGKKSPASGVGGRPKRVRRPPQWYGDF